MTSSSASLFKVLGHVERSAILKQLMTTQATLSQLGVTFRKTPAHIRHHLKVLEQAGLVEFVEARPVQGGPEKYYRATQRALLIHQAVLPDGPKGKLGVVIGSIDPGLTELAARQPKSFFVRLLPLSSLDSLIALRQGLCDMSACHLLDPQSGQYNRSFVRHLFPSQPMALLQVYRREEGFIVPPSNPLRLRSVEDLAQPQIRLVNREPGSGVRQWLDCHLQQLGLSPTQISGYAHVVQSHRAVAQAIQSGQANAGIGLATSAKEFGLEFIPLYEEPYEIVMPRATTTERRYAPFFDYFHSGEFRATLRHLEGYVVPQRSGEIDIIQ